MNVQSNSLSLLSAIRLVHTLVWAFFVACIIAIPVATLRNQLQAAVIFSVAVLIECLVLALNRARCPLTDLASRSTSERADNFDIYLPLWLARNNKVIFGVLFAAAELFVLLRWLTG